MQATRHVIITGAGRGIGMELVKIFGSLPGFSVLAVSRHIENIEMLKDASVSTITALPFDITQKDFSALHTILQSWTSLDILINNAGMLYNRPFEQTEDSHWQSTFEVNVFGTAKMVRECLPYLRKSKSPQIINIGSMGGIERSSKFPGLAAYSASKAAVANLTECLAEELQPDGIRCNCLALGAVQTEMLGQAFPGYVAPHSAVEMAGFIVNFALHSSPFLNGKIILVSTSTP